MWFVLSMVAWLAAMETAVFYVLYRSGVSFCDFIDQTTGLMCFKSQCCEFVIRFRIYFKLRDSDNEFGTWVFFLRQLVSRYCVSTCLVI